MKGLRNVPRILKINKVRGYQVSCLFNNGESRLIDFKAFFSRKKLRKDHPARILLNDITEFRKIEIIENTIGWKNVGMILKDMEGNDQFYYFDLDPIVLYEFSRADESRTLKIGQLIKNERKRAGLTQEELAKRSGTSKHYISRLENNKSDIELLTLKKIIEAGPGRDLKIQIQ
ncbi:MAG: helix-turn-helix domain-containing protein [Saprospiraceae bacterium]|nr:helix-turn-helix domain-containing protein [Saprospiraceae bacterium]